MLKNYLKTAFRNLSRKASYAVINVLGLAIGIGVCLLIFLVVQFETSFDSFHRNKSNIYRLETESHSQDGVKYMDGAPFATVAALRTDFPEIKQIAAIYQNGGQITIDDSGTTLKKLTEKDVYYTEPNFFDLFNFGWLAGDPRTSLKEPNSAVLTQATAEKFFGNWQSAIGKTFKVDNETPYTVTGILADMPSNTDFPLSVVLPYSALRNTFVKNNLTDWVSTFDGAYIFIALPPGLTPAVFNNALKSFAVRHKPAEYARDYPIAEPLSEMHFDDRFGNYNDRTFSHSLVNALFLIGLFLIIIACVNFINLATAQAITRAKEVGVRKVLGSNRFQLAIQFLFETTLIALAAVTIACVAAKFSLPALSALLEVHLSLHLGSNPGLIIFVGIVTVAVIFLSGLYPATVMSGFNPATALKSKIATKAAGGVPLRRMLVVFQFAIAQVLIICTLTVVTQMAYFKKAPLGFNKAAIINVGIPGDSVSRSKLAQVRNDLLRDPDIQYVSFNFGAPSSTNNWNSDFTFDHSPKKTNFQANLKWADADYFKTFDIHFVAGRPYYPSDTIREFVVNETLLAKLGIRHPEAAIGKNISFWGHESGNIVGVIKDFNANSLKFAMAPVVLTTWKRLYQTISIKVRSGTEKGSLAYIEKVWTKTYPDYVYDYSFLDDTIANFYKQENELSTLYKVFAALAIFISCLGLYGLVSFMAVRRTKEIGIRKVLGASVRNIVYLLSKEFTVLILVAFAVAAPIAYYIMHGWLQGYSYRIHLGVYLFLLAIGGSILIAWITVGQRAISAALANPVQSLRAE